MRGRAYCMLAAVAVGIILVNILYGHHVYLFLNDQSLSKYSVYVHLQPGWESSTANILYDVTISWDGPEWEDSAPYNTNTVDSQQGRQVVLLHHGFSDCESSWSPPLYRYAADLVRSAIHKIRGVQLNSDPYAPVLPDEPNTAYTDSEQAELTRSGYTQFIPVCTEQETSSFRYAVSVNDPEVAFDVYFVPSIQEAADYFGNDGSFEAYDSETCGALNRHSYSGYCGNVGPESGLLIILPDLLKQSITKVSVSLQEVTSSPGA